MVVGGGGRGMCVVGDKFKFKNFYLVVEMEVLSVFGDGSVYLEKFINKFKYIEV